MDKNLVRQVLSEWSFWDRDPPLTVLRESLRAIPKFHADLVTVIQGVRRCGKSTLLTQLMQERALNPKNCFFINFEDPRLSDILNPALLTAMIELASEQASNELKYFFLDEIQNIEEWPKWFHVRLARPEQNHFIITGSNATLLSGKIGSALAGRHLTIELFPFSLFEFRKAIPAASLEQFLERGGFPRASSFENYGLLLREYFTDIIERDVRRSLSLRSSTVLSQLMKAVFESMGSEVSQRGLAVQLGLAPDTIGEYLAACEAAYLVLQCPFFSFSERQRLVRNRKYYPIDLGLRNAIITRGGGDRGKNLEALVYLHLRRKYREVCYWRGQGEVNFVIYDGNKIIPCQVSWDGIKERHLNAIREFKQEFPQAEDPLLVTRESIESFLAT